MLPDNGSDKRPPDGHPSVQNLTVDLPGKPGAKLEATVDTGMTPDADAVDDPSFSVDPDPDLHNRLLVLLGEPEALRVERLASGMHHRSTPHADENGGGPSVEEALSVIFAGRKSCVNQVRPIFYNNAELKRLMVTNGKVFVRQLGRGGFGTVLLVFDRNAPSEDALRVMKVSHTPVDEYDENAGVWRVDSDNQTVLAQTARFNRDAHAHEVLGADGVRASPKLFERGVVTWDHGRQHPYMTMRYHPGHTLQAWMSVAHKAGRVPLPLVADIGTLFAMQLAKAHQKKLVHRDISPGNLYLPDADRPLPLDWGLSVSPQGGDRITQANTAMGTPLYMSPELASNASQVGYPSDVYQLLAVLYHLCMGHPLFDGNGKGTMELLQQHRTQKPDLSAFAWYAPRKLTQAFGRGLRKDPENRQDMLALAEQLYLHSNLYQRTGRKPFHRFFAGDDIPEELLVMPMPDALKSQRETFKKDPPIPSWYALPNGKLEAANDSGGVERMVEFHVAQSRGDTRHGLHRRVFAATGATVVFSAVGYGVTMAVSAFSGGSPDANVSQPPVVDPPAHVAPKEPTKEKAKPKLLMSVEMAEGGKPDVRLFKGLPCEIRLEDRQMVVMTKDGQPRAVAFELSGEQVATLFGYKTTNDFPQHEQHLKGGIKVNVVLLDQSTGEWMLHVRDTGYVTGRANDDARRDAGSVYTGRADLRLMLEPHGFGVPEDQDYLKDPILHRLVREFPVQLDPCPNPGDAGPSGMTRQNNLTALVRFVRTLRDAIGPPKKAAPEKKDPPIPAKDKEPGMSMRRMLQSQQILFAHALHDGAPPPAVTFRKRGGLRT